MRNIQVRFHTFVSKNSTAIIDHFVILILAFVPFWRTGYVGIFNKTDMEFPLYPVQQFINHLFTWDNTLFAGCDAIVHGTLIHLPTELILAGLAYIGLPPGIIERVYLISLFALLGWGMYYLVKTIASYEDHTMTRIACLFSSVFYMINVQIFAHLSLGHKHYLLISAVIPFTFAFFIKGFRASLKGERTWTKYAILISFCTTFLFSGNYALTVLVLMLLVLLIVYHMVHELCTGHLAGFINECKFTLATAFASFLLNLWWLLPFLRIYLFTDKISAIISEEKWGISFLVLVSKGTDLLHTMCLLPRHFVAFAPFHPEWLQWYGTPAFMVIGLTIAGLALFATFLKPKSEYTIFFTFLALISLFFSLGLNSPLGFIYLWLWNNFSFFRVFRDPYAHFHAAVVLGYAVLLGISVAEIYKRLSNLKNKRQSLPSRIFHEIRKAEPKLFLAIVLLLILILPYPILSGNLDGNLKPFEVPDYYYDAREWLKNQDGDFRVMIMPQVRWLERYSWFPDYDMIPIIFNMFPKPVLLETAGGWPYSEETLELTRMIYDSIVHNRTSHAGKLLSLLNVKYVCVRDDMLEPVTKTTAIQMINTTHMKAVLESQKDMRLIKTFDKLHFYKNEDYRENNSIYGASSIIGVQGSWEIYRELYIESLQPSASMIFFVDQFSLKQLRLIMTETDLLLLQNQSLASELIEYIPSNTIVRSWSDVLSTVGWTNVSGTWKIVNGEYSGDGRGWHYGTMVGKMWTNFVLEANVKIMSGSYAGIVAGIDGTHYYNWHIRSADENFLLLQRDDNVQICRTPTGSFVPEMGRWYKLKMVVSDNHFKCYVDDELKCEGVDTEVAQVKEKIGLSIFNTHAYFDDVRVYPINITDGTLISTEKTENGYITSVISNWHSHEPSGTSIKIYVSADGGAHWEGPVVNGSAWIMRNTGANFKYKAVLLTTNPSTTPELYDVSFDYSISDETRKSQFIDHFVDASKIELLANLTMDNSQNDTVILGYFYDTFTTKFNFMKLLPKGKTTPLTFEKINPTKSRVDVNADEPFVLISSIAYDSTWEARIIGSDEKLEHIIANGYANGWIVTRTGKYSIVLEYKTQKYFVWGVEISTVVGIAIVLCYLLKKYKIQPKTMKQRLLTILQKKRGLTT